MTIYLVIPLLALVGLIQATFVPRLAVWGVFPDLPLVLVVSWGLLRGPRQGLLWGFVAGIIVDLFSGAPFGAATVPLMAVGFIAGLGQTIVFRNFLLPPLAMFWATVVYDLMFLFIVQISGDLPQGTGHIVEWSGSLVRVIGASAVLNALLAFVIPGGMRVLDRRFRHQDVGMAGL
jgi:rod shape-determining protein MreD